MMARGEIGRWISGMIPVDTLVGEPYREWRPLVEESFQFLFSHLSEARLAQKVQEQMALPVGTSPEARLLQLIAKMPGLQKLGQVLARNRRLSPELRQALTELENGMSDVTFDEVRAIIQEQLGPRLQEFGVQLSPSIFKEGSASAVLPFTWKGGRGVFKVLKSYVPECFAEDIALLQELGESLRVSDVRDLLTEVGQLLAHELDFEMEQQTLEEARRMYRSSFGIRVPEVIRGLCTSKITAMSEESGLKVTEAFRRSPIRRSRIPDQLIEALIAVPLFCREDVAVFHADPHAGNLMYDETNRELAVIDWALVERLSLEARRQLVLLVAMVILRNKEGVLDAMYALSGRPGKGVIEAEVARFFERLRPGDSPGALDAMRLLDETALAGVHFPSSLFFFRKSIFTLDGVLQDVAGSQVRIDYVILREFLTRCLGSFGMFHAPLELRDFAAMEWNALLLPARWIS